MKVAGLDRTFQCLLLIDCRLPCSGYLIEDGQRRIFDRSTFLDDATVALAVEPLQFLSRTGLVRCANHFNCVR